MTPNNTALTWTAVLSTGVFLSSLAGILYNRVASPDYDQLVGSIKANAFILYPGIPTAVCTFRVKPAWFEHSKEDTWTATLTRHVDKLVLKKVHGRSSREAALKALDSELMRMLKENREQMVLEGDYAIGEEFEERNRRDEEDGGSDEGLCYGERIGC